MFSVAVVAAIPIRHALRIAVPVCAFCNVRFCDLVSRHRRRCLSHSLLSVIASVVVYDALLVLPVLCKLYFLFSLWLWLGRFQSVIHFQLPCQYVHFALLHAFVTLYPDIVGIACRIHSHLLFRCLRLSSNTRAIRRVFCGTRATNIQEDMYCTLLFGFVVCLVECGVCSSVGTVSGLRTAEPVHPRRPYSGEMADTWLCR